MASSEKKMVEAPKIQDNMRTADAKSHTSSSARRSTHAQRSMVSVAAATARAEAEAARARASFVRKEIHIKIEKARLEAELEALKQEAEAEAAIAKAIAMENAAIELSSHGSLRDFESLPSQTAQDKVSEYVERHSQRDDSHPDEQFDTTQQMPSALLTLDEEHGSNCQALELLSPKPLHSYGDCEMPQHSSPRQAHFHHSEPCQPDGYKHSSKLDSQPFQSQRQKIKSSSGITAFELINPDSDTELRPKVTALLTKVSGEQLGTKRFERFSSWSRLTRAIARLLHVTQSFHKSAQDAECVGWHYCKKGVTSAEVTKAEQVIIKSVQHEVYAEEMACLERKQDLPGSSPLKNLHPDIFVLQNSFHLHVHHPPPQLSSSEVHRTKLQVSAELLDTSCQQPPAPPVLFIC
ncbi:hypothetical protein FQN60_013429 [Etheostoma spectabile]|uniref:Uncharacterized protein n=1 Tax=Etheostoma spectabile TaxID=54343 RepID=A0A5J5CK15_9PERO|nr:hypothetical protein FQN60_013429 [Etheostoma spectabile]